MRDRPEEPRVPEAPRAPSDEAAVPVEEKRFWHDGYEPIRRRRSDEPTDVGWPLPDP